MIVERQSGAGLLVHSRAAGLFLRGDVPADARRRIPQSTDEAGRATLRATGEGLAPATLAIETF